jgi:thiosulfate/3-mercaptopyruvate sulfurtransferase
LRFVDMGAEATYRAGHIPGAIHLAYEAIVLAKPPAMGLLPDDDSLAAALAPLGLTSDTHVVAYDGEGSGRAARLLWTLDAVGHAHSSLLDGGLGAWQAAGGPTETDMRSVEARPLAIGRQASVIADKTYILAHLDEPGVVVLDVRTPGEFNGQDLRAARGGHIPGAVNMDWTLTMDPARAPALKPVEALHAMLASLGVTPDKEIIVHCQTHHRSSHTYVVLKSLGFDRVRGYDGSWSDWGNDPDLPVES